MKVEVKLVNENLAQSRGGEVVLYRRPDSQSWQARFKLKVMQWHSGTLEDDKRQHLGSDSTASRS